MALQAAFAFSTATCFNGTLVSHWPLTPPAMTSSAPRPFIILFDGSSGSSWFADSLDRHEQIFIAGYEPLEWVTNASYVGPIAEAWQPSWLHTIWQRPTSWSDWLSQYHRNSKLDPAVHHAPLTVRMPLESEVKGAAAVGIKVRPSTITDNRLAGTLKEALYSLGGVVLVINRRSKLEQSVSLYRRRFEGRASQFLQNASVPSTASSIPDASTISAADLSKLLDHRRAQEEAIDCLVMLLERPTIHIAYEDLLTNFSGTMRDALTHLHVGSAVDDPSIPALNAATSAPPSSSAASTTAQAAAKSFVKRSPSSLCASVANIIQLCEYFTGTRYAVYFAAVQHSGRCTCTVPTSVHGAMGASKKPHGNLSIAAGLLQLNAMMAAGTGETNGEHAAGTSFSQTASQTASSDSTAFAVPTRLEGAPLPLSVSVVGTHHKTGTVLIGQVLRMATQKLGAMLADLMSTGASERSRNSTGGGGGEMLSPLAAARAVQDATALATVPFVRRNWSECVAHAKRGKRAICQVEHARWADLEEALRLGMHFVHLIRDPLETCISAYQYHLVTTEAWVHQPREELRGLSWQQYLRNLTDEQGVVAECVRGLPELRDMAELHVRALPFANRSVTTLRLEHVSTHFTQSMTHAFDNLLPPLGLPALSKTGGGPRGWEAPSPLGGPTSASKLPKEEEPVGHAAFSERLAQAASKFDLSRHPPPPDKVDHVSDKDAKIRLREVLLKEKHLRPLLRGLRLSLGYEAMQTWQLPPDIERLSAAVDQAVGSFCPKGWAGRVGEC